MNFEGGQLEGARYGGLTPLDYTGLAAWYRATDGVTFMRGNGVSQWNDLSGNNRHLISALNGTLQPSDVHGAVYNTISGLMIAGGDGNRRLYCLSDTTFQNMFYDGRKLTIIMIFRNNFLPLNQGYNFIQTTPVGGSRDVGGYFSFGCTSPNGNQAHRVLKDNVEVAGNDTGNGSLTAPKNYITSVIDYGYNASSPNLHRKVYIRENTTATFVQTLKTERKFNQTPATSSPNGVFTVAFGGGSTLSTSPNGMYELIVYDQTGKSELQIIEEHDRLYQEYINPRYPNLFL